MSDTIVEVRVPDLLTVMEAGTVARISRTTAYDLAHQFLATNGAVGMPVKRVGGQLRVPRRQFEEWIGTQITTWPPLGDTDIDDTATSVIAVNDTPQHRSLHQGFTVNGEASNGEGSLYRERDGAWRATASIRSRSTAEWSTHASRTAITDPALRK